MITGQKPPGEKLKPAADFEVVRQPMLDNLIPFPPPRLQPGEQLAATRTILVRLGNESHAIDITYSISRLPPESVSGTIIELECAAVPDESGSRLHLMEPSSARGSGGE